MLMPEYYKVALPIGLREEIVKLFNENQTIANLYNNNPVKFIEDAVRNHIRELKKEYST